MLQFGGQKPLNQKKQLMMYLQIATEQNQSERYLNLQNIMVSD